MSKPHGLDIDRIAFFGRTYAEYLDIFGLEEDMLQKGRVLDCPGGASSFAYEAARKGFCVSACDILYDRSAVDLFDKGNNDIDHVFEKFDDASDLYVWDYYHSKEEVMALRRKALELFAEDYSGCPPEGRYVRAELPRLPFDDNTFSLVLSGHFLFLYGDRLDLVFHKECLNELMRVSSGEVRLFPIVGLDTKPYPHMDEIMEFLEAEGIQSEIKKVPLEFQRGANRVLILRKKEAGRDG